MPLYAMLSPLIRNVTFMASMLQVSCVAAMIFPCMNVPAYRICGKKQASIPEAVMVEDISMMYHLAVTDQEGHETENNYRGRVPSTTSSIKVSLLLARLGKAMTIRGTSESTTAKSRPFLVKDMGPD